MSLLDKRIVNPLQEAVKDPEQITDVYRKLGLWPYYGDSAESSHCYLTLLYELASLSPSKSAVINFYNRFGFEGKIDLFKSVDSCISFDEQSERLSDDEKKSLINRLAQFDFSFNLIKKMTPRLVRDNRICGNRSIIYEEIEIAGKKSISIKYLSPRKWMYRIKKKSYDSDIAVVFNTEFSAENENQKKFEEIPVHPRFKKTARGTKRVIHLKSFRDRSDIYGRPPSIASLYPQFIEYSNLDTSCKVSNKAITASMVVFLHKSMTGLDADDSSCADEKNNPAYPIRKVLNRDNDTSETVAVIEYDGEHQPKIAPVELSKDTAWYKCQMEDAEKQIFKLEGVPPMLVGSQAAKGSLGGNSSTILDSTFKINYVSSISAEQDRQIELWDIVFKLISEYTGIEQMKEISVKFPNKLKELIDETNDTDAQGSEAI